MLIRISRYHINAIEQEAMAAFPDECCGLIIGRKNRGGDFIVEGLAPSANVALRTDRFEIDPALLIRTQRNMRNGPDHLIGVYHSHPSGQANPSDTDIACAVMPGWVWLISALDGAALVETLAFCDNANSENNSSKNAGNRFSPLKLVIQDNTRLAG
jgi:desampylase